MKKIFLVIATLLLLSLGAMVGCATRQLPDVMGQLSPAGVFGPISVDVGESTITVSAEGEDHVFVIKPDTRITLDGEDIDFEDLPTILLGDTPVNVEVFYFFTQEDPELDVESSHDAVAIYLESMMTPDVVQGRIDGSTVGESLINISVKVPESGSEVDILEFTFNVTANTRIIFAGEDIDFEDLPGVLQENPELNAEVFFFSSAADQSEHDAVLINLEVNTTGEAEA